MTIKRNYHIGSEWIYFKIYTGFRSADKLIIEHINPFVTQLITNNIINEFFFIRYNDPDFHIRLRLKLHDNSSFNAIFQLFETTFKSPIKNGLIINVQCDTYQREIERYGQNTIDFVESIFYYDSFSIIKLVQYINQSDNAEQLRWLVSLSMINDLLDMFEFDIHSKATFLRNLSELSRIDQNFTQKSKYKILSNKYRQNKIIIENQLERNISSVENRIREYRNTELSPIIRTILSIESNNKLAVTKNELVASIIHMSMNRLFEYRNRTFEMVIYFFLHKYYDSFIIKNNLI
jgi:thiopeptide-type bacteriocin biosynthesis protein